MIIVHEPLAQLIGHESALKRVLLNLRHTAQLHRVLFLPSVFVLPSPGRKVLSHHRVLRLTTHLTFANESQVPAALVSRRTRLVQTINVANANFLPSLDITACSNLHLFRSPVPAPRRVRLA